MEPRAAAEATEPGRARESIQRSCCQHVRQRINPPAHAPPRPRAAGRKLRGLARQRRNPNIAAPQVRLWERPSARRPDGETLGCLACSALPGPPPGRKMLTPSP